MNGITLALLHPWPVGDSIWSNMTTCKTNECIPNMNSYGGFLKWWYPKMDDLQWKTLLNWMVWGYHHLRKHPYWKPEIYTFPIQPIIFWYQFLRFQECNNHTFYVRPSVSAVWPAKRANSNQNANPKNIKTNDAQKT